MLLCWAGRKKVSITNLVNDQELLSLRFASMTKSCPASASLSYETEGSDGGHE